MDQPVSDKVKDKILKPFMIKDKKYYITITELKLTNSDKDFQEIKLYCIPKKGIGLEHAKYNNISKSIYTFKIDNKLVTSECNKSIKLNNIPTKDKPQVIKKLLLLIIQKDIILEILLMNHIFMNL